MGKMKENTTITKKDIWRTFWRWWWTCEMSNSYERMQSVAYCYAMMPVLRKLYPDNEDYSEALQRHLTFFNTEGIVGSVILGISVAMEEERVESQGKMPGETIIAVKTALMGPVAGIGDTITWGTVKPLIFTLALTASVKGSILGFFLLFLFVPATVIYGWYLMVMGYKVGKTAFASLLESGWINRIITGAGILGLFMIGALSATTVKLQFAGTYMSAGAEKTFQSIADGLVPGMLPLLAIMAIYMFIKKKGHKFGTIIIATLVIAMSLSFIGIV